MDSKTIDASIKPLFRKLEETGILLDEEKLIRLIQGSQKRLAEQKQAINREVGFTVDLHNNDHWNRVLFYEELEPELTLWKLLEARTLSSLTRKLQQVYDLANGNHKALGRQFGLYPKYGLDADRKIITTSELSISDLPEEVVGVISYQGMTLVKATYSDIVLSAIQKLSGDPWIAEATETDLVKLGFISLFEDYRIGKLGCQIFAISFYSTYLFAPEAHVDLISLIVRECLENAHPDFVLAVSVTTGSSLDKLM